jgi:hypothetical protein
MNLSTLRHRAKFYGNKAAAVGTGLLASGAAFAQSTTAGDVTAIIDEQKTLALAVVVAGTIAMLAIKYSKMARRA